MVVFDSNEDFDSGDFRQLKVSQNGFTTDTFYLFPLSNEHLNYSIDHTTCSIEVVNFDLFLNKKLMKSKGNCSIGLQFHNVVPSKTFEVIVININNMSNCLTCSKDVANLSSMNLNISYSVSRNTTNLLARDQFNLSVFISLPQMLLKDIAILLTFQDDSNVNR